MGDDGEIFPLNPWRLLAASSGNGRTKPPDPAIPPSPLRRPCGRVPSAAPRSPTRLPGGRGGPGFQTTELSYRPRWRAPPSEGAGTGDPCSVAPGSAADAPVSSPRPGPSLEQLATCCEMSASHVHEAARTWSLDHGQGSYVTVASRVAQRAARERRTCSLVRASSSSSLSSAMTMAVWGTVSRPGRDHGRPGQAPPRSSWTCRCVGLASCPPASCGLRASRRAPSGSCVGPPAGRADAGRRWLGGAGGT